MAVEDETDGLYVATEQIPPFLGPWFPAVPSSAPIVPLERIPPECYCFPWLSPSGGD